LKKKGRGHYCHQCGRYRPNQKFTGQGHKKHLCKDCLQELKKQAKLKNDTHVVDQKVSWTDLIGQNDFKPAVDSSGFFDDDEACINDQDLEGLWFFDDEEEVKWFFDKEVYGSRPFEQNLDEPPFCCEKAYEISFFDQGAFIIPAFDESQFNWTSFDHLEMGLLPFIEIKRGLKFDEPSKADSGQFDKGLYGDDPYAGWLFLLGENEAWLDFESPEPKPSKAKKKKKQKRAKKTK
jgi:hypothetical protein